MRQILVIVLLAVLAISCNSGSSISGKPNTRGEIIPKKPSKKWTPEKPHGMIPIKGGSFVQGMADQDFTYTPSRTPSTTVTVSSFFMDETEVTNAEYRFFVNYVRDSIVRDKLAQAAGEGGGSGPGDGSDITDYAYKIYKNAEEQTPYEQFLADQGGRDGYDQTKKLDWSTPIYYNVTEYPSIEYAEILESMYYTPEERFDNKRTIDPRKLVYEFRYYDQVEAVKNKGRGKKFLKVEQVLVYPDTTCWLRDFNYSYNEPMFEQYFWHEAFNEYPVVGVDWRQARAFCEFKTQYKNNFNASLKKKKPEVFRFRLPSESEWEYAARGGKENATYPWGGPYLTDDRGCYLANFKPKRGNYIENEEEGSFLYTGKVKSYDPNGFGLYDMAGNVSEWTDAPYNNSAYLISSTMNPYLGNRIVEDRKVIRGGSWKDIGYFLMTGSRDWEHKDSARSYIGFRTVQTIPESAEIKYRRR